MTLSFPAPRRLLLALLLSVLPLSLAAQTGTLGITPTDTVTPGDLNGYGGWGSVNGPVPTASFTFTITAPIQITALCYYQNPLSPLTPPIQRMVQIVDSDNPTTVFTSGLIDPITSPVYNSSINVDFRYTTDILQVPLAPGITYQVNYIGFPGDFNLVSTAFTPGPGIVPGAPTANLGGNFFYTVVPEPSCAALLVSLGMAFAVMSHRHIRRR